jgi:hypothetical protein
LPTLTTSCLSPLACACACACRLCCIRTACCCIVHTSMYTPSLGVERFETAAPGESADVWRHRAQPHDYFRETLGSRGRRGAQDASDGAAHSGIAHLPGVSRCLVLARSRLALQLSGPLCHRHRGPTFRGRRRGRLAHASMRLLAAARAHAIAVVPLAAGAGSRLGWCRVERMRCCVCARRDRASGGALGRVHVGSV